MRIPNKAMILAAGSGTRLRPLTDRVPKAMVPVVGKPVLQYAVERLRDSGVREIAINLCHLPRVVMDHFGDGTGWGVKIHYSVEQEALGTAGGVKRAQGLFDGPFFVWYGDNLSTIDLAGLYRFHRARGGVATMALCHWEYVNASGIVGVDADGRITRFLEKPSPEQVFSHWINAGIYVLEPQVLDAIPPGTCYDFGRDLFPALLDRGDPLYGYQMSEGERLWLIDTPGYLERVERELSARAGLTSLQPHVLNLPRQAVRPAIRPHDTREPDSE